LETNEDEGIKKNREDSASAVEEKKEKLEGEEEPQKAGESKESGKESSAEVEKPFEEAKAEKPPKKDVVQEEIEGETVAEEGEAEAEAEAEKAEEAFEEEERPELERREEVVEEDIVEERIYTIPLRRVWISPRKKRVPRAVRLVKAFIQRHMKPEALVMSNEVNEKLWSRGIQKPPRRIRVRAVKDREGTVTLYLAEGD
jgi:large subunit ribosomal protein L31e